MELTVREGRLYECLAEGGVRCLTCERFCEVSPGQMGFCKTRKNLGGRLFFLQYGHLSSLSANPIEKKPLFHFYPGSRALTAGSWSCNFRCPWCQNWTISKTSTGKKGHRLRPEEFVNLVKQTRCQGTSLSFNEPTLLLEYALDLFPMARKEGFYNTFVTNGYMSQETLTLLARHGLDAMNIDIKGGSEGVRRFCQAEVEPVWRNALKAKALGIHVEITTLVIPGVNSDPSCLMDIGCRIKKELGEEVPWHVTRYHQNYEFSTPQTGVNVLEKARQIGLECGLKHVYVGNVPGHPGENTYCPGCGEILIERSVFEIRKYRVTTGNTCPSCGCSIPMVGSYHSPSVFDPSI